MTSAVPPRTHTRSLSRFVARFQGPNLNSSNEISPDTGYWIESPGISSASPSPKSPAPILSTSPTTINSDPIGFLSRTYQRPTLAQRTVLQRILSHKVEESSQIDSELQLVQLELEDLQKKKEDLEKAAFKLENATKAYISIFSRSTSDKLMKKLEELELASAAKESRLQAFRETLFNARMSELRKRKAVLERTSPKKAADVVTYLCILSSARLLPPEVLSIIFHHATRQDPQTPGRPHSPVTLSHVCFTWRESATRTPTLWNNIDIQPTLYSRSLYISHSDYSPMKSRISSWSGRARPLNYFSVSLKIDAEGFTKVDAEVWSDMYYALQAVAPHVTQLSIPVAFAFSPAAFSFIPSNIPYPFCSESVTDDNFPFFFALPGNTFSELEKLRLIDITEQDWGHPRITMFEEAHKLRRVALNVQGSHFEQYFRTALPWKQLTHLDMWGSISADAFAHIMFSGHELQSASFDFVHSKSSSPTTISVDSRSRTILAHLSNLRIRTNKTKNIEGILKSLEFPSITSLEIIEHQEAFPLSSILPCLSFTDNSNNLKSLSLFRVEVSEDLTSLLNSSPEIETLQLYLTNSDPERILQGIPWITLPKLSRFLFIISDESSDSDLSGTAGAFGDLVSASRRRGAPLQSAKFYVFTPLQRSDTLIASMVERVRDRVGTVRAAAEDTKILQPRVDLPPSLVPGGPKRARTGTLISVNEAETRWPAVVLDVSFSEPYLRSLFGFGGWEPRDV